MLGLVIATAQRPARSWATTSPSSSGTPQGPWIVERFFKGERRKQIDWAERTGQERGGYLIVVGRFIPAAARPSRSPAGSWRCAGTDSSVCDVWPESSGRRMRRCSATWAAGRSRRIRCTASSSPSQLRWRSPAAVELFRRLNRVARALDATGCRADRRVGNRVGWSCRDRSGSGSRRRDRLREQGRVADRRVQRARLDRAGDPLCTPDELLRGHPSEPAELPRARLRLDARHHERLHGVQRLRRIARRSARREQDGAGPPYAEGFPGRFGLREEARSVSLLRARRESCAAAVALRSAAPARLRVRRPESLPRHARLPGRRGRRVAEALRPAVARGAGRRSSSSCSTRDRHGNHVAAFALGTMVRPHAVFARRVDHYSLLAHDRGHVRASAPRRRREPLARSPASGS